jgi:hypothetical protein
VEGLRLGLGLGLGLGQGCTSGRQRLKASTKASKDGRGRRRRRGSAAPEPPTWEAAIAGGVGCTLAQHLHVHAHVHAHDMYMCTCTCTCATCATCAYYMHTTNMGALCIVELHHALHRAPVIPPWTNPEGGGGASGRGVYTGCTLGVPLVAVHDLPLYYPYTTTPLYYTTLIGAHLAEVHDLSVTAVLEQGAGRAEGNPATEASAMYPRWAQRKKGRWRRCWPAI